MQSRIVLILAAILSFIASPASAQDYPNRPVTLIVPWPAGGTTDIGMRALASATEKHLKQKIVVENRGGFCYELNGLFNELLRELGFVTRLLSARVAAADGSFTPEYDHAAILVIIGEMQYLADVGFGTFVAQPLRLVPDLEQEDEAGNFIIRKYDAEYFEVAKKEDFGFKSEYIFKPLGHDLSEFADRCDWQQFSPDSHFTKGRICSLMTPSGRKTLTDDKFILTDGDSRTEAPVISEDEFESVLFTQFGIHKTAFSPDYSLAER